MKKFIYLSLTSCLLMACHSNVSNSTSIPTTITIPAVSNIDQAMDYLRTSHNYTLKINVINGAIKQNYNIYHTEYGYSVDNQYGLGVSENGVFTFDYYLSRLTPSELLIDSQGAVYPTYWGAKLVTTLADLDKVAFTGATATEFTLTNKIAKLNLLKILELPSATYDNIADVNVIMEDKIEGLAITLTLNNGASYKMMVADLETTTISILEDHFAAGKKEFIVPEDLARARDLFSGFSYTRFVFEDSADPVAFEIYNPNYFVAVCPDEAYAQEHGYECNLGVIGLDDVTYVENGVTYYFDGAYYITVRPFQMTTAKIHDISDVTTIYNYPTYLYLFKNLQYFDAYEGYYTSRNIEVLADFVTNFQLSYLIDQGYSLDSVDIELDLSENDGDCIVLFRINVSYGGEPFYAEYVYTWFNETELAEVENFLAVL